MESLLQNLQRMIRALETLSEKNLPDADQIDELLDQLFQQKIDLVNANTNPSSAVYQQASQALSQAATRAERAAKDPAHLREMLPAIDDAIGKLAKVLNNSAS